MRNIRDLFASRIGKIVLYVVGTILILGIVAVATAYISPQVYLVAISKIGFSKSKTPQLYTLPPTPRTLDTTEKSLQSFDYFGISFSVPWSDKPEEKLAGGNAVSLKFKSNKGIILIDERNNDWRKGIEEEAQKESPQFYKQFIADMYGGEFFNSKYDFYKQVLTTSPSDISVSQTTEKITGEMVSLMFKGLEIAALSKNDGAVYSFEMPSVKGFQFGVGSSASTAHIFTSENASYLMAINGTQEEADSILSSVRAE